MQKIECLNVLCLVDPKEKGDVCKESSADTFASVNTAASIIILGVGLLMLLEQL